MHMTEAGEQLLLNAARDLGLDLESHLPRFARYFDLLTEANKSTNLTAIRDEEGIVLKHFVDSLTCLIYPRLWQTDTVIDVGTGAGFPGLPLAIVCPNIRFDLLDATKKKISFLEVVINDLGLKNATAIWGRSEELSHDLVKRETYGVALARAVASIPVLMELTLPLIRVGGFALLQKTAAAEAEIKQAQRSITVLGGSPPELVPLQLPKTKDQRSLVIINKTRPTPRQYPRKAGVSAKNPLS
ncbi:MAG: 16S rRNA (guanine(527)-N(7))-methyltransferase RsmG [Meiothermus sp.]|nr:16S rRNA (guanine(527)-N(7))-methyltransferase RsmG [Meiothermus sp.]